MPVIAHAALAHSRVRPMVSSRFQPTRYRDRVVSPVRAQAIPEPERVLGVDRDAAEPDIKRAYRRLALRHHPDANKGDSRRFVEIHQAYEILIGRARGEQSSSSQANGWAFHDWYWNFATKHRGKRKQQAPPPPTPLQGARTVESQLQGLRRRAAMRKAAAAAAAANGTEECVPDAPPGSEEAGPCWSEGRLVQVDPQ